MSSDLCDATGGAGMDLPGEAGCVGKVLWLRSLRFLYASCSFRFFFFFRGFRFRLTFLSHHASGAALCERTLLLRAITAVHSSRPHIGIHFLVLKILLSCYLPLSYGIVELVAVITGLTQSNISVILLLPVVDDVVIGILEARIIMIGLRRQYHHHKADDKEVCLIHDSTPSYLYLFGFGHYLLLGYRQDWRSSLEMRLLLLLRFLVFGVAHFSN